MIHITGPLKRKHGKQGHFALILSQK